MELTGTTGIRSKIRIRSRKRGKMSKLTLRDLEVSGQRVLVRVDFNVPTEERDGQITITDDTRIRESLPTINHLREQGAKTILMAHFGRPKGKPVEKYSLRPVADYLHTLIDHPVAFSHDTIGKIPEEIISRMKEGDVPSSRTSGSIRAKRRTIPRSPRLWRSSATFT